MVAQFYADFGNLITIWTKHHEKLDRSVNVGCMHVPARQPDDGLIVTEALGPPRAWNGGHVLELRATNSSAAPLISRI